jgi:hypothetical protein
MTIPLQTVTVIMSTDKALIDNLFCGPLWIARQVGRAVDNYRWLATRAGCDVCDAPDGPA